jgi:DNA-binding CsgD family transcriptional regulator
MRELTPAELAVLQCMADDCDSREGAKLLGMAPNTYRTHAQSLHRRLGVKTNAGVVAIGFRRGWVH